MPEIAKSWENALGHKKSFEGKPSLTVQVYQWTIIINIYCRIYYDKYQQYFYKLQYVNILYSSSNTISIKIK